MNYPQFPIAVLAAVVVTLLLCASPCAAQSPDDTTFLHDEAGIAAYTKALTPINLLNIAQVLDTATFGPDYIKGTLTDIPYALLVHDVHIYAHEDGWMITYFPPEALTSELFLDGVGYDFENESSVLEHALRTIASANGVLVWQVDYFDFRYPNADWMLWLRTYGPNTFQLHFPYTYNIYDQSWAMDHNGNEGEKVTLMWDDKLLSASYSPGWIYGELPIIDTENQITYTAWITAESYTIAWWSYGVFAFTYAQSESPYFSLEGSNVSKLVPLRYPRELINDTTPPEITHLATAMTSYTHGDLYTLYFLFNELALHTVQIDTYYSDTSPSTMRVSSPNYDTFGRVSTYCIDCSYITYQISAYDMSGNYFQSGVYTIERATLQDHHAYIPTLKRNQEATP